MTRHGPTWSLNANCTKSGKSELLIVWQLFKSSSEAWRFNWQWQNIARAITQENWRSLALKHIIDIERKCKVWSNLKRLKKGSGLTAFVERLIHCATKRVVHKRTTWLVGLHPSKWKPLSLRATLVELMRGCWCLDTRVVPALRKQG